MCTFKEWKWKKSTFSDNGFPEVNISVEISKDKARMLKELERTHSYLSGKSCVESILFDQSKLKITN